MAGWTTESVWTGAELAFGHPDYPVRYSGAPFTAPSNTVALALNEAGTWSVVWVDGFPGGNGFTPRFAGASAVGTAENGDRTFVVRPKSGGFQRDTWAIFAITDTPDEGGGAVSSVFGRAGAVVATSGDYDSDLIENVSNVAGSSVSDALNQLDSDLSSVETTVSGHTTTLGTKADKATTITAGAGLTGGGDFSANRTINIAAADGSITVNADSIAVGVISDAQHGTRAGGTLHAAATTSVAGFMSAADKSKLDGLPSSAPPTSRTVIGGNGLIGGGSLSSDVTINVFNSDGSLTVGADDVSVTFSNADPNDLGTRASGTAIVAARIDHVHAHGSQSGGTLHAVVTTSVAGFMSASDKTKLDGIAAGATVAPALSSTTPALVSTSAGVVGSAITSARADHVHQLPTRTATRAQNLLGWTQDSVSPAFRMEAEKPVQYAIASGGTTTNVWFVELGLPLGAQTLTSVVLTLKGAAGHAALPSGMPKMKLDSWSQSGVTSSVFTAQTDASANTTGYQAVHTITWTGTHSVTATSRYVLQIEGETGTNTVAGLQLLGLSVTCTYI